MDAGNNRAALEEKADEEPVQGTGGFDVGGCIYDSLSAVGNCVCRPCCSLVNKYAGDTQLQIQIIFALYFVIGTTSAIIFYVRWNYWTVSESFYYTIQAAMSVGFGVLEEDHDMSRFGSLIVVCSGSLGLATLLGLLVAKVLSRYDDLKSDMEDEFIVHIDADADGKVEMPEFKKYIERIDPSLWKRVGPKGVEKIFHDIDTANNGVLSLTEYQAYTLQNVRFGWFSSILAFVAEFKLFIIFTTYIMIGCVWGMVAQDWTFITALYYAFTACATGGLQQPKRTDGALLFTAFYVLMGIPLYAMTLGTVASYFGEYVIESMMAEEMENREAQRTVNFMERLDVLGDGRITFEEWLCLELLRNNRVSIDFLQQCKHDFDVMDEDSNGSLSVDELKHRMPVIEAIIAKAKQVEKKTTSDDDIPENKENENKQTPSGPASPHGEPEKVTVAVHPFSKINAKDKNEA